MNTMKENQQTKARSYKMFASRGSEIIFDDRITADSPRDAREQMKKRLGLNSLSGIVCSVTGIPIELIREIVDARVAELLNGSIPQPSTEDPAASPDESDWDLVRRHYKRYGDPAKTAEKYGLPLDDLEARAGREEWAA